MIFSEDEKDGAFAHATAPTDVVLDALLRTREVAERSEDLEKNDRESLRKLFECVKANVGTPNDETFVVRGVFPMGNGDSDWFWIVRVRQQSAESILYMSGHALRFERRRTKVYLDVTESTGTPSQPEEIRYRYDGSFYRSTKTILQNVKP